MAKINLPPQAYTQDELAEAYIWLNEQPDYIQNLATSTDSLVSLYKRHAKNGGLSPSEIAMAKTFQTSLKELSNELKQFTDQPTATPAAPASAPVSRTNYVAPQTSAPIKTNLDPLTENMIHEVKNKLNLSSENEALRMLVKLGFEKAKTILPH